MGDDLETALWLGLAFLLVWIAAPPAVAMAKGYDAERWFLACGPIGVVALAFFPRLGRRGPTGDEADRWRTAADQTGEVLSGLQVTVFGIACAISAWKTYIRN